MGSLITISLILTSLAGIVTSLALLWAKVAIPFYRFCKRLGVVVDTNLELPERLDSLDESVQQIGPIRDELQTLNEAVREHIDNDHIHGKD